MYIYIYIYTHLYVCVFNFAAEKRTLDSRCTTLAWTSCLDIRSCCNNNFFNFFRPFLSFSLSMSPLKLSMHSTQTLPCGRLPSVMRNSRVGQRQGVVHQHVPFKFSAPSIVAEDALCRFWSLLGHLVALTMLEAKSVFCIRRFCFSVLLLAMLPWHQYTNKVPLCQISVYVCLCLCLVCICKKNISAYICCILDPLFPFGSHVMVLALNRHNHQQLSWQQGFQTNFCRAGQLRAKNIPRHGAAHHRSEVFRRD